jgi:hypothetical protein
MSDLDELLVALWESGQLEPGTVIEVDIIHDDDCPRLYGDGLCNCAPDLRQRSHPSHQRREPVQCKERTKESTYEKP